MREFQVYFKGLYIGRLLIDEEGRYLYYLMDHAKTSCFLSRQDISPELYTEQKEFGPPIPIFQEKLKNSLFNSDLRLKNIT